MNPSHRAAWRTALADAMPATIGLTITHGGGYSPVCMRCGKRLAVVVARRSAALTLLDDHELTEHADERWAA
jgi:hypothetical protein